LRWASAEGCPCGHQFAPLIENIAPSVRGLDLIAGGMCERRFGHKILKSRFISAEIFETRPKTVDGNWGISLLWIDELSLPSFCPVFIDE
jgi:hypothetical protein